MELAYTSHGQGWQSRDSIDSCRLRMGVVFLFVIFKEDRLSQVKRRLTLRRLTCALTRTISVVRQVGLR